MKIIIYVLHEKLINKIKNKHKVQKSRKMKGKKTQMSDHTRVIRTRGCKNYPNCF